MSNPNNLIRPAQLQANSSQNPNPPQNPNPNPPPNPNTIQMSPQLEEAISSIFRRLCVEEFGNIARAMTVSNENIIITDQEIFEEQRTNLIDLEKVPDVVKSLRDFAGNHTEFSSWKKSVERILKMYEPIKGTAKYFGILNVIRNKIVGSACTALESYNTPLNWDAISKCLTMHYADKRDLGTLEYQMSTLVQGQKTLNEYYQAIYTHLSLLLNKIACMGIGQETLQVLTKTYRDKALDTFIRGLNGNLPDLLGVANPTDLPQALQLCLKMQNQNFRTNHAQNRNQVPIPPRRTVAPNVQHNAPRNMGSQGYGNRPFYPQLAYIPRPPQLYGTNSYQSPGLQNASQPYQYAQQPYFSNSPQPQFYQNHSNPPPRPMGQKPLPRPEPMDIDQSIRSRAVNYVNRPKFNQYLGKGHISNPQPGPIPDKRQRNFHIETEGQGQSTANNMEDQNVNYAQKEEEDETSFEDYLETLDKQEEFFAISENGEPELVNMSDVHFLD